MNSDNEMYVIVRMSDGFAYNVTKGEYTDNKPTRFYFDYEARDMLEGWYKRSLYPINSVVVACVSDWKKYLAACMLEEARKVIRQ